MKRLALLLLPLAAYAAAPVSNWSPNVTGTVAWQGNVSNGEAVWDRIGALQVGLDDISSSEYVVTPNDSCHVTWHFGADVFPRFTALDRGALGARLDWQHTFGNDAMAPIFSVEAAGDGVLTGEAERRGFTDGIVLRLSKRCLTGWRTALIERFDDYHARKSVFDSRGTETAVEIGRDINDSTRLVVTGRWRDGDVVTYAQYVRPDLMAIALANETLNTFKRRMTAYATNARTVGGRVALVHATADDRALILAYDYANTRRTNLKFANWTVSLSLVRQF